MCKRISDLCGWVEQFGYEYQGHSLDALRDGFAFEIPEDGGLVLELERPDILWREHRRWVAGLLEIASEHSRVQLAAGRRFFATLIVPPDAEMIGTTLFDVGVPACWSLPGPQPPFR